METGGARLGGRREDNDTVCRDILRRLFYEQ